MAERRFYLVDVFGSGPISGNPLAVVVDSDGLSAEGMQELTRWLGYSETTFLAPPSQTGADYSVRIFTLSHELPFAGHPTLGSAHVWSAVSGVEQAEVVQECGVGLVDLRFESGRFSFRCATAAAGRTGGLRRPREVLSCSRGIALRCGRIQVGEQWPGVGRHRAGRSTTRARTATGPVRIRR